MTTFVGTLNLSDSRELPENIVTWVPRSRYSIYIIGIQAGNMTEKEIGAALDAHLGEGYTRFAQRPLSFLKIFAYVVKPLSQAIAGVETAVVSLLKGMQNQGGVAVSFWFYDTPVVFVCVWLVPDDSHLSGQRNPDPTKERRARCGRVNDILSQLRVMLRSPWPERGNALTSAFKHVVVFGEFNFRVEMPRHRAETLSAEANYEEVFLGDQLRMMRGAGDVLAGFCEATPEFAPVLDGLGAHWPSRVLYHAQQGYGAEVLSYGKAEAAAVRAFDGSGRWVPIYAVLRLEAVAPVLDRLRDFSSLTIRGTILQVSGLALRGLSPPDGAMSMFSDKRSADPYVSLFAIRCSYARL
jgi:hypothetical protein